MPRLPSPDSRSFDSDFDKSASAKAKAGQGASGIFAKSRIIAPPDYNRWLVPPASVAIHLCIGSVYAWSLFNPPLMKIRGVAASAADDWTQNQVVWIFSVAIVFLGLSAAFAGKWLERVGPRLVGAVSACCWGGGFLLGALGIQLHQLWLLYLGYGVIGGCGLGLGYVSPVSTLIKWFPDRRGMAAGLAIMGFGGGALAATPLKEGLIELFHRPPVYVGSTENVRLVTEADGRRFAILGDEKREVVVVGPNDVKSMIVPGPQGAYLVGTGSAGVAQTFAALGIIYFLAMIAAAFSYRLPASDWRPRGWTPPSDSDSAASPKMISRRHVNPDQALKTPQFYGLWIVLCFNVTAGIGVLAVAKTMMTEIYGSKLPLIVTASFASWFVWWLSVFNMAGRFFWASASDYLGRKRTYAIFFSLGIILYLAVAYCAWGVGQSPRTAWLVGFYAVIAVIMSMYGGGFATIPAYLADIFGARHVGAIHGRLLTAWSVAGLLGPWLIGVLRDRSLRIAIDDLSAKIDPIRFESKFGASISQLPRLVEAKTVTLTKLMEIAPSGTIDPSSTLYNTTMFLMAGLLGVALVSNALIRPVDARHHEGD